MPTPSIAISPRSRCDVRDRDEAGVERERSAVVRALEADQELVTPRRRIADGQHDGAVALLARLERAAGDARQLVAGRQRDLDRPRLALHDGHVDQRDHPHVGVAERDERHDVGERSALRARPPPARCRASTTTPRSPSRASSVASTIVRPSAVDAARDEAGRQMDVGLIARQIDRRPRGAGRRHRQHERRASGRERQRRAPLERQRERTGPRQQRRVRVAVGDERQRPAARRWRRSASRPTSRLTRADAGAQHVAGQR